MKSFIFTCLFLLLGTTLYAQTEEESQDARTVAMGAFYSASESAQAVIERSETAESLKDQIVQLISDLQVAAQAHPEYSNPTFQANLASYLADAEELYIIINIKRDAGATKMASGISLIEDADDAACAYDWVNSYNYAIEARPLLDANIFDPEHGAKQLFDHAVTNLNEYIDILDTLYCIIYGELYVVNNL